MNREFKAASQIVPSEVVKVVHVIHIVDFNLEALSLLEVVLDVKALDPHRVEVVVDYLCDSNLLPHVTCLSIKTHHSICSCKRVKVR